MKITNVNAIRAYTDQGPLGIEVRVTTERGALRRALCAAPQMGTEQELLSAVRAVNDGGRLLLGCDAGDQTGCDARIRAMDAKAMGSAGVAALSQAVLSAGAAASGLPVYRALGRRERYRLPVPAYQAAMGGNRYGAGPAGVPYPIYSFAACGFDRFSDASYGLWETVSAYTAVLSRALGFKIEMDSENCIPKGSVRCDEEILALMTRSIEQAGLTGRVGIVAELGAGRYYDRASGCYRGFLSGEPLDRAALLDRLAALCAEFPILAVQDPLEPGDLEGFTLLTGRVPALVFGGEALGGRQDRLAQVNVEGAALLLPQLGTLTDAAAFARRAEEHGLCTAIRGDHGEDVSIADYAVGLNCGLLLGCGISFVCDRLLEIEEELGGSAAFAGPDLAARYAADREERNIG